MDKRESFHIYNLLIVWSLVVLASGQTPGTVGTITTSSVTDKSLVVSFDPVTNGNSYCITVTPRHEPTSAMTSCEENTSRTISNLRESILYDVSVQATSSSGEKGASSNVVSVRTFPSGPVVTTSNPQPEKVFLFMDAPNYASVTEWTIEYMKVSDTVPESTTTTSYALLLKGLTPNTEYQVRARASGVLDNTATIAQSPFGEWKNFTTDKLTVFGRVTLNNVVYNATSHNDINSEDYKAVLQKLVDAYSTTMNVDSVTIVVNGIQESMQSAAMGFVIVNYALKITDKTFPNNAQERSLFLSGSDFYYSVINSNDPLTGNIGVSVTGSQYDLTFCPSSACSSITRGIERTVTFTEENGNFSTISIENNEGGNAAVTVSVQLNSNDATQPSTSTVLANFSSNSVYGFEYKFLVQDFSDETGDLVYFLSYKATLDPFVFTTGLLSTDIDLSNASYTSSNNGTVVTITFAAVDKAIAYEIIKDSTTLATLEQNDIDASRSLRMTITGLTPDVNNTLMLRVVTKKHDGETDAITSSPFTVTSSVDDCEICGPESSCYVSIMNGVQCTCGAGYTKNGNGCIDIDECDDMALNNCSDYATCINIDGGFLCTCFNGYTGNGVNCTEIEGTQNATCHNSSTVDCTIDVTCTALNNGDSKCVSTVNVTHGGDECLCFSGSLGDLAICRDFSAFYSLATVSNTCSHNATITCECNSQTSCDVTCSACNIRCDSAASTITKTPLYHLFTLLFISFSFIYH